MRDKGEVAHKRRLCSPLRVEKQLNGSERFFESERKIFKMSREVPPVSLSVAK